MKVLVTAASRHEATEGIAQAVARVLSKRGLETTVAPPEQVESVEDYDAVVLGSAVYTGHWLEPAKTLVDRSGDALASRPVWLFSSGPVGDPSRKLVQQMGADPVDLAEIRARTKARDHRVFAGALERKDLGFGQRVALKAFPGLQGDFRDWPEIRAWAAEIAAALEHGG
jgi:menaquinone-dependent protoporphyrinogen oxidase